MSVTVARAPRRNRQFWIDHVIRWKRSGLSKAAYCQSQSLNAGSFYSWSRPALCEDEQKRDSTQRPDAAPLPKKSLSFVPVTVLPVERSAQVNVVRVQRAATDVSLPIDLNPEQIHHWLCAIHQLHV